MSSLVLVSDGDSAVLDCHVRANPLTVDDLITWSRRGYELSRRAVVETPSVGHSRLTIASVRRRDAGAFHCNAFNGVGLASSAVAQLVVKCTHSLLAAWRSGSVVRRQERRMNEVTLR